jgi:hypothetical protein
MVIGLLFFSISLQLDDTSENDFHLLVTLPSRALILAYNLQGSSWWLLDWTRDRLRLTNEPHLYVYCSGSIEPKDEQTRSKHY